jgi:hypothetical protein
MKPSPIPEDIVIRIQQQLDDEEDKKLIVGRDLLQVWSLHKEYYIYWFMDNHDIDDKTKAETRAYNWYCAHMAGRLRRSITTIFSRMRVADYATPDMISSHPAFTYSDWNTLLLAEEDRREYWINWMYNYAESDLGNGSLPIVEHLRDKILEDKTKTPIWKRRLSRLIKVSEKLLLDDNIPDELKAVLRKLSQIYEEWANTNT